MLLILEISILIDSLKMNPFVTKFRKDYQISNPGVLRLYE